MTSAYKTAKDSSLTTMKSSLSILAQAIRKVTRLITDAYLRRAVLQRDVKFESKQRRVVYSRYFRPLTGSFKQKR